MYLGEGPAYEKWRAGMVDWAYEMIRRYGEPGG